MKYLYLVKNGWVEENDRADDVADGINSIAALAEDLDEAQRLASQYDCGEITPENVQYNGRTISALQGGL